MRIQRGYLPALIVAAALSIYYTPSVIAESLKSTNYQFDEPNLTGGSLNESSSNNFKGMGAYGDIAVGETNSSNFQFQNGSLTTPDPTLSVKITSPIADFGKFSASSAATSNATFEVINYTSYGYAVQMTGSPPTYNNHTLAAMATTSVSQPGIEQFGINMVANTAPTNFGANPDNGQFGFGQIGNGTLDPNYADYSTPNEFRYVSGETIASAPKSSGKTIYTISFIVNVAGITPGGQYIGNQNLLVTGTY